MTYSSKMIDYLGGGLDADKPVAATLGASLSPGMVGLYLSTDVNGGTLYSLPAGGSAWAVSARSIIDTDPTLAAYSDLVVPSQKAAVDYIEATFGGLLAAGLLKLDTGIDASSNPNYPSAIKGYVEWFTVAGKIGGASGVDVAVGDAAIALVNTAGGDQAAVGSEWIILRGSSTIPIYDNAPTLIGNATQLLFGLGYVVTDDGGGLIEVTLDTATAAETLAGTASWKVISADALAALWEQGADIASAGTLTVGEGGHFHVTGTTAITDIDLGTDKAGRRFSLTFTGILTLTHNASTLILPTGANITTAAGDSAVFVSEGSDVVRCVSYQRASGAALASSGGDYVLLATVNASGSSNVMTASSLDQTYSDLIVVARGRSTSSNGGGGLKYNFNADTGNNYRAQWAAGGSNSGYNPTAVGASTTGMSSFDFGPYIPGTGETNFNLFVMQEMTIFNYTSSSGVKDIHTKFRGPHGVTGSVDPLAGVAFEATGVWQNTAALNEVKVTCPTGNFAVGSQLRVYGRK